MSWTSLPHERIDAVNFNERAGGAWPDILLMHYTGVPTEEFALEILTSGEREVSCHYMVREDGRIVQMVGEDKRAWHAGKSSWQGGSDINSRSIGIEICNPGHGDDYHDFPHVQIAAVLALSKDIMSRHAIPPHQVLGHSDVAPGRKVDPGEKFPWRELAADGVGMHVPAGLTSALAVMRPDDEGKHVAELQHGLAAFGYNMDVTGLYDSSTATVVHAFQMHFRQHQCDGVADAETQAILNTLLERLAVS